MQERHALGGALIAAAASAALAHLAPAGASSAPGEGPGAVPASALRSATSLPGDVPSASLGGRGTDAASGDLDRDGWTDLVVVRKRGPARASALLMNVDGQLEDHTVEYGSASDVPGDRGLLTPADDRCVFVADLDGDAWLDVVTAGAPSDVDPKHLGHPRVYRNLGAGAGGAWLGLRHEDARVPQLVSFSSGLPRNPRCSSVTLGDVNGDGFPDLCLGDREGALRGDRLLVNDGHGYFSDQSELRGAPDLWLSGFSQASILADFDGDGIQDGAPPGALIPPDATMRPTWQGTSSAAGAAPAAPSAERASAPAAEPSSRPPAR